MPFEKRQNRGLDDYFRPPSVKVTPGLPPLPQKLKLKNSPSFSDWLRGTPNKASLHANKPWLNKSWDRWEKEILKNVKALH
jgi:hypothetical protein